MSRRIFCKSARLCICISASAETAVMHACASMRLILYVPNHFSFLTHQSYMTFSSPSRCVTMTASGTSLPHRTS